MTADEIAARIHEHTRFRVTYIRIDRNGLTVFIEKRDVYGLVSKVMLDDLAKAGFAYHGHGQNAVQGEYLWLTRMDEIEEQDG